MILAQQKDRDDEHARGGGVTDDEDDDERWRRGEKRKKKKKKSDNKTQQNKGTKTRTRVACVRGFFITLSLSVPQRSPRSTEYSIPGERAPHPCVGWMKTSIEFSWMEKIWMKTSAFSRRCSSIASSAF